MKVMAFNARPDERAFFDHFSQSLDMDLTLQKDTLTLDNVALTRGYDGISCTCDLPAPILEKLAENGVRYVALRTIGYDNVDLEAAKRLSLTAGECMVFEDAPYAGVTAKKAGFALCGMAEPAYAEGEDTLRQVSDVFVEHSFAELADKL